jgi:hypothetical protein
MRVFINFLSWMVIGGTLNVNNIHWNSVSFWIILIALMVAERTSRFYA